MRHLFSRTKLPQVDRQLVLAPMSRPPFHRIRLERCPKGIDGLHIDVALDSKLVNAGILLVKAVLRRDVSHYFQKQAPKALSSDIIGNFQKAYMEHSRMVLQEVRRSARPELAQLFQLAVVRLLLVVVDQQFGLLRQEIYDARALPAREHGSHNLELHDRAVALARNEDSIRTQTLQDVFRILLRMEDSNLRKVREAILGMSWPVPRGMLANSVVQLGGLGASEDFFQFYPHILRDNAHAATLASGLFEVLSEWLPDELELAAGGQSQDASLALKGGHSLRGQLEIDKQASVLIEQGELAQMIPHEFDNAEGIRELLGGDTELWPESGRWDIEGFGLVQRARVREYMAFVEKAGLMAGIQASYQLNAIYPLLGIRGGVDWVYDFLAGKSSGRELMRRLQTLPGVEDARSIVRKIEEKLQSSSEGEKRNANERALVRFAADLVKFRYDLKLASWMYTGLSSMRLMHDEEKLSMSASNGLLQDFRFGQLSSAQTVIGHTVIKADIRGSTEITAEMQERNLNPATYFSRTLYDPITRLLGVFGAEKVFVEGDAVILSLMEYEGDEVDQLAVARACGLARRILRIVESKNAESKELGLPQLGLGIGVSYASRPPTYLYDEEQKIMISPAINRADRLSSCHAGLRRLLSNPEDSAPRVLVAQPLAESEEDKSDAEGLLHYNVNGIELSASAFDQLGVEIMMEPIQLPEDLLNPAVLYHVGRYADAHGDSNWLVVREAPVKLWLGDRLVENERADRVFYEVISEQVSIDRVVEIFEQQSV